MHIPRRVGAVSVFLLLASDAVDRAAAKEPELEQGAASVPRRRERRHAGDPVDWPA